MDDIASQYKLKLDEFDREIKKVENKAKKAMRFVLWMKVILSIATVIALQAREALRRPYTIKIVQNPQKAEIKFVYSVYLQTAIKVVYCKHSKGNNKKQEPIGRKETEMKELICKINHEENFDKAQGMLEMLNAVYGTKFGFLNKRVVRFENPDASTAEKYSHCYDAWSEL